MQKRAFINRIRSFFNIEGYLLPELTSHQQLEFLRDPVRYFLNTDEAQSEAITREVESRQRGEVFDLSTLAGVDQSAPSLAKELEAEGELKAVKKSATEKAPKAKKPNRRSRASGRCADPVVDITDLYVFPNPERPGSLVLVLDVFPNVEPTALFSDAVDYQFRVRPVKVPPEAGAAFAVSEKEYTISCRFAAPIQSQDGGPLVQEGACIASTGQGVSFRVNDEEGGKAQGLRVFAGRRLDPFLSGADRNDSAARACEPRRKQAVSAELPEHRRRSRRRHHLRGGCRAVVRRRRRNGDGWVDHRPFRALRPPSDEKRRPGLKGLRCREPRSGYSRSI